MSATTSELPGFGSSIAWSFLSLALVCGVAYLGLRWLARRTGGQTMGPLRVVSRCPLEPRRSVYIVEAAGRFFLVGAGDGPLAMLAELDPGSLADTTQVPGSSTRVSFAQTLARVTGRGLRPGDER